MSKYTAPRRPAITQKWIFHKLLLQALNNWMWIAMIVLFSASIAFLVNRYTSKIYNTTVEVVKGGIDLGEQDAAYLFGGGMESSRINIKYERAFITSLPIMQAVIKDLNMQVSYFSKGRIKTAERYGYIPVHLSLDYSSERIPYGVSFTVIPAKGDTYTLTTENEQWSSRINSREFVFGTQADVDGFVFTLDKQGSMETGNWIFKVNALEEIASDFQQSIYVEEITEGYSWSRSRTSMIQLSMKGPIPHKDREFLDQLVVELREQDVVRKIEQSERTISFIEDQLFQITDSMKIIAAQMRALKLSNKELSAGSSAVFGRITTLEEEKTRMLLVNRYCDYLENYIQNASDDEILAPSTFGIENDILGGLVRQYIDLKLEYQTTSSMNISSMVMQRELSQKEAQAKEIEGLILKSIGNTRYSNQLRIDEYNDQIKTLFASARSVLSEEIIFADFERLYGLNEKVFTLLMDKKAEAGITQASMISDYSIFEPAKTSNIPLRPLTKRNYITAFILGLLIPIGFLFIRTLNKNTILSLTELEEIINLPVAGVIGNAPNTRTILDTPQSLVAENFRSLRSNLRFVNGDKENTVFVITSSVSDEGKTFISANLAAAMALQGKKTIVVGGDMRKPSLDNYYTQGSKKGLSDILIGQATLKEVIQKGSSENLDVLYSGSVPPNPAELLSGQSMVRLVESLRKKYDAIFIDTPPIGLISDASEIFELCDTVLLVTRQQKTPVATIQHADHFMDDEVLSRSMLIFNGVRKGVGYGYYGYGYGYGNSYGYYNEERRAYRKRKRS